MQNFQKLGDLPNYSIYTLSHKMGLAGTPNGGVEQQIITQPKYDIIYPFINGHAIVKTGDCYGLIDKCGVETIPAIYKYILPNWEQGYFYVSDNRGGDEHYIDCNNRPYQRHSPLDVLANRIKSKENIRGDHFFVVPTDNPAIVTCEIDDLVYVYNTSLDKVINVCNDVRIVNGDKLIVVDRYTNKKGVIDIYGRQLVPNQYDDLFYCATEEKYVKENLLEAIIENKSGYIDFEGNVRVPFIYRFCGTFINGYAWVSNESGKVGMIDRFGNVVEPLVHDNIIRLSDGRAVFINNGFSERYYVMGESEDYVKQHFTHQKFHFDIFHNPNYVGVETGQRKRGVTLLDGTILIPAIYDDITFWQTMYKGVVVKKNNKKGVVDIHSNILLPFDFDSLSVVEVIVGEKKEAYYIVGNDGKYGLLDSSFKERIPVMYSRLEYHKIYNGFIVEVNRERAMVDLNNDMLIPFTTCYISTC